jgi:hypothetical protein
MVLTTGQPGNLFAFGQKAVVQVEAKEAKSVAWQILDLDQRECATGEAAVADGKATIEIANLPHGYYELAAKAG